MERKMTVREFINDISQDIDVYNNVDDTEGIAYCPPIYFTDEGNREFHDVLSYMVEVDENNQQAVVICDDDTNVKWQHKKRRAEKLFWSLAGYCSSEQWDLWFTDSRPRSLV